MRPTSKPDSYIRHPLDQILGYPANIQLLRILIETGRGMNVGEIAERTGLSVPGVHKVLSRLLKTGVIQQESSGRAQLAYIRKGHPLTPILAELFQTEKNNFGNLLNNLKETVNNLEQKPKAVWMYGKAARGTDDYGDPLQIAIYGAAKTIDDLTDQYKDQLAKDSVEKNYDVTIEVRGITAAETDLIMDTDKVLIWGYDLSQMHDDQGEREEGSNSHRGLDNRSLNDADLWIDFIKTHPEIIERTKAYLKDKIRSEKSGIRNELKEWHRLLESMSFQRLKKFMQSDSERSTRLRQSLPFWPVLTESERKEFKTMTEK